MRSLSSCPCHHHTVTSARAPLDFTFTSFIYVSSRTLIAICPPCHPLAFPFTLSRSQLRPSLTLTPSYPPTTPLAPFSLTCPHLLFTTYRYPLLQSTTHPALAPSPSIFPLPPLSSPSSLNPISTTTNTSTAATTTTRPTHVLIFEKPSLIRTFFHAALSSKYSVLRGRLLSVILSRGRRSTPTGLCVPALGTHTVISMQIVCYKIYIIYQEAALSGRGLLCLLDSIAMVG